MLDIVWNFVPLRPFKYWLILCVNAESIILKFFHYSNWVKYQSIEFDLLYKTVDLRFLFNLSIEWKSPNTVSLIFWLNVRVRVVNGTGDRLIRSDLVEDSLPVGRSDFFSTGLVWIFWVFACFYEKMNLNVVFSKIGNFLLMRKAISARKNPPDCSIDTVAK